jgi:hypothetical protein
MASATATACGPVAVVTLTTQMISSAVCALRMLACLPAAARLAAAANAAGSVWQSASLATRRVMSCRLGGSFTYGTVNVVCDISGLAEKAALALLAAERCAERSTSSRITRAEPPFWTVIKVLARVSSGEHIGVFWRRGLRYLHRPEQGRLPAAGR